MWKILVFGELTVAFSLLFIRMRRTSIIHNIMRKAYASLEEAANKRTEDNRKGMAMLQRKKGRLYRLEQRLLYSGLTRRLPFLSPEVYVVGNLFLIAVVYVLAGVLSGIWWLGIPAVAVAELILHVGMNILIMRNYNATDEGLLKFLDFLGNYSLTSGEVTGVLQQVSGYLEEPLRTVLEECYYEAQMSGDTSIALLSMAEKIQHPKFKELVRNLEITMRYSADFTVLVSQSRRSVREYMRLRQERKALASEAWVNILILGGMTVVILKAVEALIGIPIEEILLHSWVGRVCMGGIGFILFLFYNQIRTMDK